MRGRRPRDSKPTRLHGGPVRLPRAGSSPTGPSDAVASSTLRGARGSAVPRALARPARRGTLSGGRPLVLGDCFRVQFTPHTKQDTGTPEPWVDVPVSDSDHHSRCLHLLLLRPVFPSAQKSSSQCGDPPTGCRGSRVIPSSPRQETGGGGGRGGSPIMGAVGPAPHGDEGDHGLVF